MTFLTGQLAQLDSSKHEIRAVKVGTGRLPVIMHDENKKYVA